MNLVKQVTLKPFHAELHSSALQIDSYHTHSDMLMELNFFCGVFYEVVCQFADVDKTFGVDTGGSLIPAAKEMPDFEDLEGELGLNGLLW